MSDGPAFVERINYPEPWELRAKYQTLGTLIHDINTVIDAALVGVRPAEGSRVAGPDDLLIRRDDAVYAISRALWENRPDREFWLNPIAFDGLAEAVVDALTGSHEDRPLRVAGPDDHALKLPEPWGHKYRHHAVCACGWEATMPYETRDEAICSWTDHLDTVALTAAEGEEE